MNDQTSVTALPSRAALAAEARSLVTVTLPSSAWAGPERRAACSDAPNLVAQILDEIDYGLLLLDGQRRVLHANRAALVQIGSGRVLAINGNELRAIGARDKTALIAAIQDAEAKQLRRLLMIGGEFERLGVAVIPLPGAGGSSEARVLVLLSRPHICEALSAHGFARDHGLSGAEAHVLDALCQGLEPAQIATVNGIAISTVRTHLSNIRLKTDVASIRELVQRIARLPPMRCALRSDAALSARAA